jgi:hypothetical protein
VERLRISQFWQLHSPLSQPNFVVTAVPMLQSTKVSVIFILDHHFVFFNTFSSAQKGQNFPFLSLSIQSQRVRLELLQLLLLPLLLAISCPTSYPWQS